MAQSNLIYPLESLHGKISKKSETIFRHKAVYDKNGNVIAQYAKESYVVEHLRDWKKHLPKGAKKQSLDYWITICQRAKGGTQTWRDKYSYQPCYTQTTGLHPLRLLCPHHHLSFTKYLASNRKAV